MQFLMAILGKKTFIYTLQILMPYHHYWQTLYSQMAKTVNYNKPRKRLFKKSDNATRSCYFIVLFKPIFIHKNSGKTKYSGVFYKSYVHIL